MDVICNWTKSVKNNRQVKLMSLLLPINILNRKQTAFNFGRQIKNFVNKMCSRKKKIFSSSVPE